MTPSDNVTSFPNLKKTLQAVNILQSLSTALQDWAEDQSELAMSPMKARGIRALFTGLQKPKAIPAPATVEPGHAEEGSRSLATISSEALNELLGATDGYIVSAKGLPLGTAYPVLSSDDPPHNTVCFCMLSLCRTMLTSGKVNSLLGNTLAIL